MAVEAAIAAFRALAHGHRLAVFRLLLRTGDEGLPAGVIAARLGIPPSSLSFHLAHLERAALIRATRRGRQLLYAVDVQGTRRLVAFLTQDCCGGRPELCGFAPVGDCHETATLAGLS